MLTIARLTVVRHLLHVHRKSFVRILEGMVVSNEDRKRCCALLVAKPQCLRLGVVVHAAIHGHAIHRRALNVKDATCSSTKASHRDRCGGVEAVPFVHAEIGRRTERKRPCVTVVGDTNSRCFVVADVQRLDDLVEEPVVVVSHVVEGDVKLFVWVFVHPVLHYGDRDCRVMHPRVHHNRTLCVAIVLARRGRAVDGHVLNANVFVERPSPRHSEHHLGNVLSLCKECVVSEVNRARVPVVGDRDLSAVDHPKRKRLKRLVVVVDAFEADVEALVRVLV